MQVSDTARRKPRLAAAPHRPEPRRVSPQPAGRHPHSPRGGPGAEHREAQRRGAERRDAGRDPEVEKEALGAAVRET